MQDVLERLNLNIPATVRKRLREMAARAGRPEGELARTLLVDAVERARRQEWYRRVAETYSVDMRERDLTVVRAFEKLDD